MYYQNISHSSVFKSVVLKGRIPVLYPLSISFQYLRVLLAGFNKTASQVQHFFPDFPILPTGKKPRIWICIFFKYLSILHRDQKMRTPHPPPKTHQTKTKFRPSVLVTAKTHELCLDLTAIKFYMDVTH